MKFFYFLNRNKILKPSLKTIGYKIYLKDDSVYETSSRNITEDKAKETEALYEEEIEKLHYIIENSIKSGALTVNLSGFVFKIEDFKYISNYSITQE